MEILHDKAIEHNLSGKIFRIFSL